MEFNYRGKVYESTLPLEITNLRDLGAYILIHYPNVKAGQFFLNRDYDNILSMFTVTKEGTIAKDNVMFFPSNAVLSQPSYFRLIEEKIEKILLKRGFI